MAAVLIQIMTNYINDLYDFKKGADNNDRVGPDRMIQKRNLSENEIKAAIYVILFVALIIGIYLAKIGGALIILIGLSSFIFAYLYTATSYSLAYNGLGEIFVFLYFGIIASLGTFYLQTLDYNYNALLIGIICGCLNVGLLIINNLRDIKLDRLSNKKTLVAKHGKLFGYLEFILMIIISYVFLYFLSQSLNKLIINKLYFLILIPLIILYNLIYNINFLNKKALSLMSLYILLSTALLTIYIRI